MMHLQALCRLLQVRQAYLILHQRRIVAVIHVQRISGIHLPPIQLVALPVVDVSHGFRQTEAMMRLGLVHESVRSLLMVLAALHVTPTSAILLHHPLLHPSTLLQPLLRHLLQIKSVVVLLMLRTIQASNVRIHYGILQEMVLCFALPTEEVLILVT